MFVINQKVILPKSHNKKEGVVVLIPKVVREQKGLTQIKGRVKVSYITGNGGSTEAWFSIRDLQDWRKPADITEELEAKHEAEMLKVKDTLEKEKLDWIEKQKSDVEVKKDNDSRDIVVDTVEVTKDTNILEEMKQAEDKVVKANKGMPKKSDDNSDTYIG